MSESYVFITSMISGKSCDPETMIMVGHVVDEVTLEYLENQYDMGDWRADLGCCLQQCNLDLEVIANPAEVTAMRRVFGDHYNPSNTSLWENILYEMKENLGTDEPEETGETSITEETEGTEQTEKTEETTQAYTSLKIVRKKL